MHMLSKLKSAITSALYFSLLIISFYDEVERLPKYDEFKSKMRETPQMRTLGEMEKQACLHTSVMHCSLFCFQVRLHVGWSGLAGGVKATGSSNGLFPRAAQHHEPGPKQEPAGRKPAGGSEVHSDI